MAGCLKTHLPRAINDAANWYDRFDLIATAATPSATQRIKNSYFQAEQHSTDGWRGRVNIMPYDVPLKGGGSHPLFVVNWPSHCGYTYAHPPERIDWLRDYFALIAPVPIPLGTEMKFSNTEAFVRQSVKEWEHKAKMAARELAAEKERSAQVAEIVPPDKRVD